MWQQAVRTWRQRRKHSLLLKQTSRMHKHIDSFTKALADEKATLNLQTALTTAQNQLKTAKTTLTTVQGYANKLSQLKVELKPLFAEQATAKATLDNAKAKLRTVTLESLLHKLTTKSCR